MSVSCDCGGFRRQCGFRGVSGGFKESLKHFRGIPGYCNSVPGIFKRLQRRSSSREFHGRWNFIGVLESFRESQGCSRSVQILSEALHGVSWAIQRGFIVVSEYFIGFQRNSGRLEGVPMLFQCCTKEYQEPFHGVSWTFQDVSADFRGCQKRPSKIKGCSGL